jgi:hypothetical protein
MSTLSLADKTSTESDSILLGLNFRNGLREFKALVDNTNYPENLRTDELLGSLQNLKVLTAKLLVDDSKNLELDRFNSRLSYLLVEAVKLREIPLEDYPKKIDDANKFKGRLELIAMDADCFLIATDNYSSTYHGLDQGLNSSLFAK